MAKKHAMEWQARLYKAHGPPQCVFGPRLARAAQETRSGSDSESVATTMFSYSEVKRPIGGTFQRCAALQALGVSAGGMNECGGAFLNLRARLVLLLVLLLQGKVPRTLR